MTATVIQAKLTAAWARERRFHHLRGLAQMIPWFVGIFLFDLLIDWSFDLSAVSRLVLLLANVGLLGWLLYRHWLSNLRRFNSTLVSLQVEKLHPGLNNLLVSYVQLSADSDPAFGSKPMIEAMRGQAESKVSPLDFRGIVNFQTLRMLLVFSGGVILLFLASSVLAGQYYAILVGRMLMPFGSLEYPTRTRIVEVIGPVAVKQGDRTEIQAKAAGEVPEQGRIFVMVENTKSWEDFPLPREESGSFIHRIPRASQDFKYYFRIGDARSREAQVKVVPPPRLVESMMTLRFPSYTGRTTKVQKGLQLETPVPAGTTIEWMLRCDQPLKAGSMHLAGDSPQTIDLVPDAKDAHVMLGRVGDVESLIPSKDRQAIATAYYHFEWTECAHGFKFPDATRYAVEVIPDKPPMIILLKPRPSVSDDDKIPATTRLDLPLVFDASDDYGLDRASLIYWVNGEANPRKPVELGRFFEIDKDGTKTRLKEGIFKYHWRITKSLPGVKEGDILTCVIEVSDNRADRPNTSQTPKFKIHVVSLPEYWAHHDRQRAASLERTRVATEEELIGSKKVKSLIQEK